MSGCRPRGADKSSSNKILTEVAQGNATTLTPIRVELTMRQAGDLRNVSRPYFVKLLDERAVLNRKVGGLRRIRLEALLA